MLRYNFCSRWFSSSLIPKVNLNSHFKFHEYVVNDDDSDMRLDRFLNLRTNLPTSTIQKKIRKNEVFFVKFYFVSFFFLMISKKKNFFFV
jgi:hypothetical protein